MHLSYWTYERGTTFLLVLTILKLQDQNAVGRLFVCSVFKAPLSHITLCGIQLAKTATVSFTLLLRPPDTIAALCTLQMEQIVL